MPRDAITRLYGSCVFSFQRNSLFSRVAIPSSISTRNMQIIEFVFILGSIGAVIFFSPEILTGMYYRSSLWRASLIAQLVKKLPAMQPFDSWVGKMPWRRNRLPTPLLRPGELQGMYSPWGRKESDTTERLSLHYSGFNSHFPYG